MCLVHHSALNESVGYGVCFYLLTDFSNSVVPHMLLWGFFFFNSVVNYSTLHQQASIRYNIWNAKSLAKPGNYRDLCQVINVGVFCLLHWHCSLGRILQAEIRWLIFRGAICGPVKGQTVGKNPNSQHADAAFNSLRSLRMTFLSCKHHFNCYASQVQGWVPVSMAPVLT